MSRDRHRRSGGSGGGSRRGFLIKAGSGAAVLVGVGSGLMATGAFRSMALPRNSPIDVAPSGTGIVGIVPRGPVQKGQREPMVSITNNGNRQIRVTVTLDDCSDGGLYDNDDESDVCSVTFVLTPGDSRVVDITAAIVGTIPYSISAEATDDPATFQIHTPGEVVAKAGVVVHTVDFKGCSEAWIVLEETPESAFEATFEVYNDEEDRIEYVTETIHPGDLETVPGQYDDKPLYKFNVHDHFGREEGDDKVLAVTVGGDTWTNDNGCAKNTEGDEEEETEDEGENDDGEDENGDDEDGEDEDGDDED